MTFRYRDILKRAVTITWRHKFLWFFGLFAVLTSNGEEYDALFRNTNFVSSLQGYAADLKSLSTDGSLSEVWSGFTTYISNNTGESFGVGLAILVIAIFTAWLIVVSQVALISSVVKKHNKLPISLVEGFWTGNKLFLPVLVLNLMALLIIYGLLLLTSAPLIAGYFSSGALSYLTLLTVIAFIILVPINLIISFIVKYATAYIIIEGQAFGLAVRNGWKLFIKNWLVSIETAIILFFINFVVSLLVIGALLFTGLPVASDLGFFTYFAISALLGAILATFQFSTWTYLFLELTSRGAVSKLARWFIRSPAKSVSNNNKRLKTG
ncbi:hypothetical protein ACFL04_03280 [Patescibacteria group bacterium]